MYFHVSHEAHQIGSILMPGHFGRDLRHVCYGHCPATAADFRLKLVEMALETARLSVAPTAPSRLNCTFVAETIDFARAFRDSFRPRAAIFTVVPVGELQTPRACNYSLITRARNGAPPFYEYMPDEAIRYWADAIPEGDLPELLYPGPLQITAIAE